MNLHKTITEELREQLNIALKKHSIREVAGEAGVDPGVIHQFASGYRASVSMETAETLASYFGYRGMIWSTHVKRTKKQPPVIAPVRRPGASRSRRH